MKKFPKLWISLAIIVAVFAWKGPQWLAFGKGVHAYLYGYPLVIADMTERLMTAPSAMAAQKPGAAPVNRLAHLRDYPDKDFTAVVIPNADTLYSIAWLTFPVNRCCCTRPTCRERTGAPAWPRACRVWARARLGRRAERRSGAASRQDRRAAGSGPAPARGARDRARRASCKVGGKELSPALRRQLVGRRSRARAWRVRRARPGPPRARGPASAAAMAGATSPQTSVPAAARSINHSPG